MQPNAGNISERERLRQLEQFRDMLMPNLSNMERGLYGALNQISFSIAAVVEALKAKGALTDEEIKVQAEKLKKTIEEEQKKAQEQNQSKIVVPGQPAGPKVVSQEELAGLKADLGSDDPQVPGQGAKTETLKTEEKRESVETPEPTKEEKPASTEEKSAQKSEESPKD